MRHVRFFHPARSLEVLDLIDVVNEIGASHPAALPISDQKVFLEVVDMIDFGDPVDENRLENGAGEDDSRFIGAVGEARVELLNVRGEEGAQLPLVVCLDFLGNLGVAGSLPSRRGSAPFRRSSPYSALEAQPG